MKRSYQRSEIYNYSDLTAEQQQLAYNEYDNCHNFQFVLWNNEPVCLSDFEVIKSNLFHGASQLSAFSAYLIRVNKDRTEATIVYAHW